MFALESHRAVILSPAALALGALLVGLMPLAAAAQQAESHGYRARESLLHMLWGQNEWLKRWVAPGTDAAQRATTD